MLFTDGGQGRQSAVIEFSTVRPTHPSRYDQRSQLLVLVLAIKLPGAFQYGAD
jgi:hypothetical protein